jgi:c(7)-type cytochrome triheme protein
MKRLTQVRFARGATVFALLGALWAAAFSLAGDTQAQQKKESPPPPKVETAPPKVDAPEQSKSAANTFNRLLKAPSTAKNSPPAEDGIHDPQNSGTGILQWPSEAFTDFAKSSDGNQVDWVGTLKSGKIAPIFDLEKRSTEPFLFDLVIVREVKGSMPNVVFPHEAHTQWLDCSNCHDEIFIPEKGANQISMAAILLGQKCGVCHGRVAFPVTDCRRCHAQQKTAEELRAMAEKSNWAKASTKK